MCGRFKVLQKKYQFLPQILKSMTLSHFVFCLILRNALRYQLISVITFNVGDFWVAVTSYKNKKLKNKERNNPVHIGPIQIHYWKLVWSYRFIRISFKPISKKVSGLKIFISDQEDNLVNAFKEEVPEAINLQFFHHFKQNAERRLSKWKKIYHKEVCAFCFSELDQLPSKNMFIIFWDFLIFLPNFPFTTTKAKRVISNRDYIFKLLHELPND